ncbi:MAG: hypothetical protein RLZ87_756 [Armatimonadota bacterium]|jgi:hypothetical protein
MQKFNLAVLVALVACLVVGGCSHDQTLSKTDEATLKHNFTRALTAEEIGHMNSAPAASVEKKQK